jgi:hypothetical protein
VDRQTLQDLAGAISAYFHRTEGCGKHCMVEPLLRRGLHYFFAIPGRSRRGGQVEVETDRLVLNYRHHDGDSEWKNESYTVRIVRTPCRLGGTRPWFLSPARGCGRRVAVLYGGGIFACRQCQQLTYRSTRENVSDRAMRRGDRLRARLGWEPGILNGDGEKPKWMRWETFYRLSDQHDDFMRASMDEMLRKFGRG